MEEKRKTKPGTDATFKGDRAVPLVKIRRILKWVYLPLAHIKAREVNGLVLITLNVLSKKREKGTIYTAFNEVKIRVGKF